MAFCEMITNSGTDSEYQMRKCTGKIRVLYVLEATVGGTREHILQLINGLDRERFIPELACSIERDPAFMQDVERLRADGVAVHVIPMVREIHPEKDSMSLARLTALMMRRRFDIVHTHSSKGGFLGRIAARLAGVRRVLHTGHVFYFEWRPHTWSGRIFRLLEWFAAGMADGIIALSYEQRDMLARLGVARQSKLYIIENGVSAGYWDKLPPKHECRNALGLPIDAPVVGMAARLEPQKGCEHYINAAKLALKAVPEARFLLAGRGSISSILEEMVSRYGIGDRFIFLGNRRDMRTFYGALDLFTLTSLWEGMPYVLLEAMAARLAIIATDIPGARETVAEGETGILVQTEDEEGLSREIVRLLRDEELRRRMGEQGRARVELKFTTRQCLKKHQALYMRI